MRLGRSVLDNIGGLDIFAIIGLIIFLSFFIALMIWVIRMKKKKVDEYSRLPLEDDETDPSSDSESDELEKENTKNKDL
jgi:cytochrome c oxidase cbb3-type subunit IV